MSNNHLFDLSRAIERDLRRVGMNQRDLVAKLTNEGEPPLTEQALSNWKRSGRVPRRRLDKLIEILGPAGETAQALSAGYVAVPPTTPVAEEAEHPREPSTLKSRQEDLWGTIRGRLPPGLVWREGQELRVGALTLHLSYLSSGVMVKLLRVRHATLAAHGFLYRKICRLAVAARYEIDSGRRVYGVLVVAETASFWRFDKIQLEAGLLGVDLQCAKTDAEAAKIIENWEKEPGESFFDS